MEHILKFDISTLPTTVYTDYGYSHKPILHTDRTADHDVLLFILSGCMPVVEDGKEFFLHAGDVFYLKKGIHHWGETLFDEDTSWYFIHFRYNEPNSDIPEISPEYKHIKNVQCNEEDYKRILTLPKHLHNMKNTTIEDKFKKIVDLFNSDNPYLMAYVNTCLHDLIVDIYTYTRSNYTKNINTSRVEQIYRYLQENVDKPFSANELEKHMELSFKHLCKIFKSSTGMTLHECHTKFKMKKAIHLLCTTDITISETSEILGFSDSLYFSNVFKKNIGMSPRTYRKKYSSIL